MTSKINRRKSWQQLVIGQRRFVKGRIPSWRKNRRRMFMFGIAQDRNMKFVSRHIYKATDSKARSKFYDYFLEEEKFMTQNDYHHQTESTYNAKFIVSCSKCVRVLDVLVLCREMVSCCGEDEAMIL